MTLDKIIEKSKAYRIADMSGIHNLGEVMEGLRDRVLFLEGQAEVQGSDAQDALGQDTL